MVKSNKIYLSVITLLVLSLTSTMACAPEVTTWQDGEEDMEYGEPTNANFWVTMPYNTPQHDRLLLSIEGQAPIEMDKVGALSWETEIEVESGDTINYRYLRSSQDSFSSQHNVKITEENQEIYDAVSGWNDLSFEPDFPDNFIMSMGMFDTWGRNYNFNWFEDTREHIAGSFERVARTGVEEVYANDFFMADYGEGSRIGSTDYSIIGEVFDNDMRDEVMTQNDLDSLAREARANGLKIGWRASMHFVDIGKYIGSPNITAEVAKDWEEFGKPKTEEWVSDYLGKWKQVMLERAEMLNEAGFDIMILTPGYMTPNYYPHEELANDMWHDTIRSVSAAFNGQVGIVVDQCGFLEGVCGQEDWSQYDFYQEADIVYYNILQLPDAYRTTENPSVEEMKEKFTEYLDDLEGRATDAGVNLSIIAAVDSYENAVNEGVVEFNDIDNPPIQALTVDWQHQADALEALFQAAEGRTNIVRMAPFGYWWDDAMDPEDTEVRISIPKPSSRNGRIQWNNCRLHPKIISRQTRQHQIGPS